MDRRVGHRSGDAEEIGSERLAREVPPDEARLPDSARYRDAARTVRFDECGPDGRMRAASVLRHAQDLAWQHSERLEYGRAWYEERGVGWVVRAVDLLVSDLPASNEPLVGTTALVGFRHVMARRHTRLFGADGRVVADALVDWVMVDGSGRPTRFPREFEPFVASVAATFAPIKVASVVASSSSSSSSTYDVAVRHADVDPLGHVNNAAWLEIVDEAVARAAPAHLAARRRRIQLEYLAVARGGSARVALTPAGAAQVIGVADPSGTPLLRGRSEAGS